MPNRLLSLSALLLTFSLALSLVACTGIPAIDQITIASVETGDSAAGEPSEIHIAWPYQPLPIGHFNTFIADRLSLGIYHQLMEPSLFMYMWATDEWLPLAGQSWDWVDDVTLQVTLQDGAIWSDGSDFTTQDVIDTFDIMRLQNLAVWRSLETVAAVDDTTVNFKLQAPSTIMQRQILREANIRATSVYGNWAQRVRDLVAADKTPDDDEWGALLAEFNAFRPDDMVVLGPYKIDLESITPAQMTLNKVETSFMADQVNFDHIVNFNGEILDITPLILTQEIDYATHVFPPTTEREFIDNDIRIIRAPLFTGPALYFNMTIHPFELPEFRRALAYTIDRDENGLASLAQSGRRQVLMTGFSDNLAPIWISDETEAQLNTYDLDRAQAEQILLDLGFSRDSDEVWLDETGNRLAFELTAPAEFADWFVAAENVTEQLTAFGIQTTLRDINYQQHPIDMDAGDFELAIGSWGAGNPHPYFAYHTNFTRYNRVEGTEAATATPGMDFPLVQQTRWGELDLGALTAEAALGSDIAVQKAIINQLALAYNELLPQIPLWERYGNNPAPDIRVTGWPDDDDPVYLNGPYADPFVVVLLLNGTLKPAQ